MALPGILGQVDPNTLNAILGALQGLSSSNPATQNNVFSNYGFNPRGGDENITALQKLGMGLYPQATSLEQFGASLIPGYEQNISGLLNALSPSGLNAQMNQNINASNEQYAGAGNEAALQAAGAGLGSGIQGGLIGANQNAGAAQANSIRNYYTSPQTKAAAAGAMMNAYGQGFSNPFTNELLNMTSPLAQQQQINYNTQSPGFLGQIGGLLGGLSGRSFGAPQAGAPQSALPSGWQGLG